LILIAGLDTSSAAAAQKAARPVKTNEVTGLELGLEGAQTAVRGSTLKWFFTLYEVVGRDELRPARSGGLRVLTSFKPDKPVAILSTDAEGRAAVDIPIPEDADDFEITIEAEYGSVHRSFSMPITTTVSGKIELIADRSSIQPGETVTFVGRAVSLPSGRPIPNRPVKIYITDQDGRSLEPERRVNTSPAGVFLVTTGATSKVAATLEVAEIRCNASIDDSYDTVVSVSIRRLTAPRMVVQAVPKEVIVKPGAKVQVEVTVRRGDGRPVSGAVVRTTKEAPAPSKSDIRTDENGRARLMWTAPKTVSGDIEDIAVEVWAMRAGLEEASTQFTVRKVSDSLHIGMSVEGGDLLPGLPSRIFVRVTGSDGSPSEKTRVQIGSPLLGKRSARTDADGVAVFDERPMIQPGIEGRDRCGGATASSVAVTLGSDQAQEEPDFERCVSIDPDGSVRVRPSKVFVKNGEKLEVKLYTTKDASRFPIELALLHIDDDAQTAGSSQDDAAAVTLIPISRQLVESKGDVRKATLSMPSDLSGEFVIRARPLIGPSFDPARGGTALIWAAPDEPIDTKVTEDGRTAHIAIPNPKDGVEGTVLIVPSDEADELMARFNESMVPAVVRFQRNQTAVNGRLLEALSAARTPRDDAAPTVLRGKTAVVMPAVQNPPSSGVLRDPIRSRARFVRGRIALVVRTLEARLEETIPDRIGDVGILAPGKKGFNREALSAVIGSNYLEGRDPMTLGGDPLTLSDLERMDPSFTFDNMARRVTRKRLLALLIKLREFVRERELDIRADGQDPRRWLDVLADQDSGDEYDENTGISAERNSLYDGWGKKMAILPTPKGKSARFNFLAPLPMGFELVSAGPDGRFGSEDDMADPFTRVLPKGSVYAEAVGEDELLARLNRIEINRATIEAVSTIFQESSGEYDESSEGDMESGDEMEGLNPAPPINTAPDTSLSFERTWRPVTRSASLLGKIGAGWNMPFTVDDEPQKWSLIAPTWTEDGRVTASRRDFTSGFPVILEAEPIRRLAPNEPLVLQASGALLPGGPKDLAISVEGRGAVKAALETGGTEAPLVIGPGGGYTARIRVSATDEGSGSVNIVVSASGGAGRREITLPIEIRSPGLLRKLSATTLSGPTELRLDIPKDAVSPKSELVLVSPDATAEDPSLARWLEQDPALIAWALTMAGRPIPADLLRRLEAATGRDGSVKGDVPLLSTACAAAAFAAVSKTDAEWTQGATAAVVSRETIGDDRRKLSIDAAIFTALSIASAPNDQSQLGQTIQAIRNDLRTSVRRYRDDPAFLARGAAALLLADSRDIRGKTMLTLAKEHLVSGFRGGRVVALHLANDKKKNETPSREGAEQLQATAALALAAHQVGDDALSADLALGLASEANTATSLGGETLFWFLAARAFGVFGMIGDKRPIEMDVSIGKGAPKKVTLGHQPVVISIEDLGPKDKTVIRVEPKEAGILPLVFASSTYVRPAEPLNKGPLRAELTGDTGFASERSAFIATISNTSNSSVDRPVLFISIPSGAELDETAKEAIARNEQVIAVDEPDARGIVRVRLKPLSLGNKVQLPISLLWSAAGRRTGLFLAAFPEDRDRELSVTPPREIDVQFRPESEF
jgi:hypothetical protein